MEADDIRRLNNTTVHESGTFRFIGAMLQEIAAQLAELNKQLRKAADL